MSAQFHLDDAALVAVLDGEPAWPERTHLDACPTCAAKLERLRGRSGRLEAILAETTPEAHPEYDADFLARIEGVRDRVITVGWWSSPILRRAAVLVLLAGALAAPPVRAVVSAAVSAVWAAVTGGRSQPPAPEVRALGSTEVEAAIEGPLLRVRFEDSEVMGDVTFVVVDGDNAKARILDSANAELFVTSDGFRIGGVGQGTVRLEVGVPSSVEEVTVLVGGAERVRRDAPTPSFTVRLGGG